MDGLNGSGPYGGASTSHGGPALVHKISQTIRYYLDKTTPHYVGRWLALLAVVILYGIRVYFLKGLPLITFQKLYATRFMRTACD